MKSNNTNIKFILQIDCVSISMTITTPDITMSRPSFDEIFECDLIMQGTGLIVENGKMSRDFVLAPLKDFEINGG